MKSQIMESASIFIIVLVLVISQSESALPKTKMCVDENRIAWRHLTPYVEFKDVTLNHSGILIDIFRTSLRACCRGDLNINFTTMFQTHNDVSLLAYRHKVDFILPVQRSLKSTSFQHYPYVPIVESPGFAFYVLPDPSGGTMMIHAIKSVAPLVILMFLMVSISGTIFWISESMSLAWLDREPEISPFLDGVVSGFYWAFVAMTTVGYGDIIPKTKPTKVFSLIWVLIGVAYCALFTSSITTMLTLSFISKEVSLPGTDVGVLKGSEEFKYAMTKQANPFVFDSINELLDAARKKRVSAVLLDAYIAAEYKDRLCGFHLHKIIEHISTNGVVFQNNGFRFVTCIRDYIFSRQMDIFSMISKRVKTLSTEHELEVSSQSLIDSSDPSIHIPLFVLSGVLALVLMIGTFRDWFNNKLTEAKLRLQNIKIEEEKAMLELEALPLSQWRTEYKIDLGKTVRDIRDDTEKIRRKAGNIIEKIADMKRLSEHQ